MNANSPYLAAEDAAGPARDPYDFWRRALAGEEVGSDALPVHDGAPQLGFYKARLTKGAPFVPVAIWEAEGQILCRVGYDDLFHMRAAEEIWTWCAAHPVSHASYQIAAQMHAWPEHGAADEALIERIEAAIVARARLDDFLPEIEAARQREKAPHNAAGRLVDEKYRRLSERIREAIKAAKQAA